MIDPATVATRSLGRIEAAMAIGNDRWPLNMVTAVRLGAVPDAERLRCALDELQRRHPPLRARIERRRGRRRFVYDVSTPIPFDIVDGPAAWTDVVEDRLNTAMPESGPLVAATLVRSGGRSDLILAYQHSIVDGVSAATLWGELLTTYDSPGEVGAADRDPAPIPAAADALVPDRYRGRSMIVPRARFAARAARDEVRFRRSRFRRGPSVDRAARTIVHTHTFDTDATQRLNRAARDNHCTLHSVLHAVVLRAVHELRYGSAPGWMRTIAFADLRPHLAPTPPAGALSPYVALTSQDVPMAPERPLWETVGDVQRRLRASVRGSAKFVSYSTARPLMRVAVGTARARLATTAVSHTGAISIAAADGPLPVEGLHAFVSNLAIGPELSLRTGSFRSRLTLDMMALDTDMDRSELAALAARVTAQLDDVACTVGGG